MAILLLCGFRKVRGIGGRGTSNVSWRTGDGDGGTSVCVSVGFDMFNN